MAGLAAIEQEPRQIPQLAGSKPLPCCAHAVHIHQPAGAALRAVQHIAPFKIAVHKACPMQIQHGINNRIEQLQLLLFSTRQTVIRPIQQVFTRHQRAQPD